MELRHGTPKEAGMLPERVGYVRDLCARWVKEGHTPTLGSAHGLTTIGGTFGVVECPGGVCPAIVTDAGAAADAP